MSPETRRKLKALMVIAMLAVAECHRVDTKRHSGDAFKSRGTSSHAAGKHESHQAPGALDAHPEAPLELDMLLKDPAFHKQVEAMAGHMDKFAHLMKAKAGGLARARDMAQEMFTLSAEPSSYADSKLPEQMEAMIANWEFQEQAQVFADDMRKSMMANTAFQKYLEAFSVESTQSFQKESSDVSAEVIETVADPHFQQQERISRVLDSLMLDSDLQKEAESIAAYIERVKDSKDHNIAQEVSEQVDAVLATTKFREKASDVVLEMLSAELQKDLDSTEWLKDNGLDELANAVENPSPELVEAMKEARRVVKTTQPSLLELNQSSGRGNFKKPTKALLAALMMMGTPGLAYNPGRRAVGRPLTLPTLGLHRQPARGSWARVDRRPQPWQRIALLSAVDRGDGSVEDSENIKALEQTSREALEAQEMENLEDFEASGPAQMLPRTEPDTAAQPLTSAKGIRSMMPSLVKALPHTFKGIVMSADGKRGFPAEVPLLICFALWFLGNYKFVIANKVALNATGGAAGFPMTIATLQLGVCVTYALFMWIARDASKRPAISFKDFVATLPVGAMYAGAHAAGVFADGAGSVSFAQIVKASEPAFAAFIGTLVYSAKVSSAKWLTLIPVIGGVCLASIGEINFAMGALVSAGIQNIFSVIKTNEKKKLMSTPGISDRIGSIGNQFAIATISAFLFMLPVMLLTEGARLGQLLMLMKTSPGLLNNVVGSGLWFYLGSYFATMVIKKTDAVAFSVASTANKVIVIIAVALVMKESLTPLKLIGSGMGISGVFLYSIIDKLVEARKSAAAKGKADSQDSLEVLKRRDERSP